MSDHVGETRDDGRETTPGGGESEHPGADDGATGVYGTAGWHPADTGSPDEGEPGPEETDPGSGGPATAVYGTAGAAAPQWSSPGDSSPQPTAVQPLPGQPVPQQPAPAQPSTAQWTPTGPPPGSPPTQSYPQAQPAASAYAAPQPAPTMQAQQVAAGYAPAAAPAPTGGRHWNLWAGIPAAAAVYALAGLWRLIKIGTTTFDYPVREQVAIGVMAAGIIVGLLTLAALATRKRGLAAPLAFLLGGVLLIDVVYGWYLQMERTFAGFNSNFLFETLIPLTLPAAVLAVATMAGALVMRVDTGRR